MTDDPNLLRRFAAQHCQASFTEFVQRHLGLVYHSALRVADGDTTLAEDAAQATFLLAAEKAATLCEHPELAGWLYTTACLKVRELRRSEQRRHRREQTASTMHDLHEEPSNDEAWNRVRPVIDDALQELTLEDRTAVVLRFFEGRAFAEIGAALRVGENAARMRVERALDRLQGALAKRGLTSTAAALASVLAVPAGLAAPTGLASRIAGAALAGGAVGGAGVAAVSIFQLMNSSKIIAVATGVVAVAGVGTAIYLNAELQQARAAAVAAGSRDAALQRNVRELTAQSAEARQRVAELEARQRMDSAPVAAGPMAEAPITKAVVDARLRRAQKHAAAGRAAEALQDYLWCFETGMPRVASYAGVVRVCFLLSYIAELGKTYPPALEALRERRDAAERRVVADPTDQDALNEYASLNRVLGEDDRSLVVFDSIPTDDPRRATLSFDLRDQLVDARRYAELVQSRPYASMLSHFKAVSDFSRMKKSNMTASRIASIRADVARGSAKDIEALAGAGETEHAREYAAKVIALDDTPETRALLAKHLARAGYPELLAP